MKSKFVIVNENGRIISSFFQEQELVQIHVEPVEEKKLLGNIYIGKVKNIVKNINAAFVEIADGIMCYYPLSEHERPIFTNTKQNNKVVIGDEIIVQVVKENIKTKAPMVSSKINFTGKYVVLSYGNTKIGVSNKIDDEKERKRLKRLLDSYGNDEYGFVARTNAAYAEESLLQAEITALIEKYDNLRKRGACLTRFSLLDQAPANYICELRDGYSEQVEEFITDDPVIYEQIKGYLSEYQKEDLDKLKFYDDPMIRLNHLYGISSKLEKALREKVWLKSGGYLVIQPTEALTVIDINTGKAIAGKKDSQTTFFKINMEAVTEIAKQIRLRNLSGIIIIDFIDMIEDEPKEMLMKELRRLFRADPIKTTVIDMTALNLVEVTRKKVRKPLHEQMF